MKILDFTQWQYEVLEAHDIDYALLEFDEDKVCYNGSYLCPRTLDKLTIFYCLKAYLIGFAIGSIT